MSWAKSCGTEAGAKRHRRSDEEVCDACLEAAALARRERAARRADVTPQAFSELRDRLEAQIRQRDWTLYQFSQECLLALGSVQRFMGTEDVPRMRWETFDKIREAVENLEAGVIPGRVDHRVAEAATRHAHTVRGLERFLEGRRRRIAAHRRQYGLSPEQSAELETVS